MVLMVLLAALGACAGQDRHAPTAAQGPPPPGQAPPQQQQAPPLGPLPPPAPAVVDLRFIPEGEPFPPEFSAAAMALSSEEAGRFRAAWDRVRDSVESRVTVHNLVEISRWGKMQTMGATLPRGWTASLPMNPLGATADGRTLLIGQREAQESPVQLPSHAPIVHRRLLAAAAYDTRSGTITAVTVTIRGWAEE
jgi:hypothetical protein